MLGLIAARQPPHLHSPTHLVRTQCANSFEASTFLVCLLLGLSYNAYVVSGYASREQTICDQTKRPCPYLPEPEEPPPPPPKVIPTKYRPKPPPEFNSKFLQGIEDAKIRKLQEENERQEEEYQRMIMELERPAADTHFGQRVHAWVVLLPGAPGPRGPEITEPLFIETSTGASYSPRDLETSNLYLGVESVWNHRNYWVNLQDCTEACTKLDWTLNNIRLWEHLLAGEPKEMRDVDDDEDEEINIYRDFHMVMPASYVQSIELNYEDYERRYPNGEKTIYYKKTRVNLYAPYSRPDGLVESVTEYEDYDHKIPFYVYEKYAYRGDFLVASEKDLRKELVTDFYAKGRSDACKSHQYFMNNRDGVDEERTLQFYNSQRLDELSRIKMHPLFLSQDYIDRDDRLYNRFVEYSAFNENNEQNDIHYRTILKIVEKYRRNHEIPASRDVATREFDFVENVIRLIYHFRDDQYTQATRTFTKPPLTERGDRLVFLPEMTHGYNPDPMASPEDFADLIDLLEKLLIEEDAANVQVRNAESEVHTFLTSRLEEFAKPKMLLSVYDPIRNEEARIELLAMDDKIFAKTLKEVEGEVDFLDPYLARLGNLKYLTKNQAQQVRDDCVDDFKQTFVNRANCMLQTYEKCNHELEYLQSLLTQSENLSKEEKEQLLDSANEMNIKLRALEVRLARHRDLVPTRYQALLDTLSTNRRISLLYD